MKMLTCTMGVATILLGMHCADARELGAIKKFVQPFPVPTYELNGQQSDRSISSADPDVSHISVDGIWPDAKMLLISFDTQPLTGYFILFRSVEMKDQSQWDKRMRATGGPRCLMTASGTTPTIVAGSNAFVNPC